jgi:aminomethyltransferase
VYIPASHFLTTMNKTILHDTHVALGAKMAPFGGFMMPIQYEGIIAEHTACRTGAVVFDTCHMGEFLIRGPTACADLEGLVTSRVDTMEAGQCRYGFLCNERGGVIDDEITYRLADDEFYMVVNAATQEGDFAWVRAHLSADTRMENLSARTAKIDLQGPQSARVMAQLMDEPIDDMHYYRFKYNSYRGERVLTSRTGYTGEIGFEIYSDNDTGVAFWDDCLKKGAKPAGLGCRDTLRLEMGYPLYGHELNDERNAAESGLSFAIASDKQFHGSAVVLDPAKAAQRLVALVLDGRRAAREDDVVCDSKCGEVGSVTSGSFSPSLGTCIAMAYVNAAQATPGNNVLVRTSRGDLPAVVSATPLYKKATGRRALKEYL